MEQCVVAIRVFTVMDNISYDANVLLDMGKRRGRENDEEWKSFYR